MYEEQKITLATGIASFTKPKPANNFIIECGGGHYLDEATNTDIDSDIGTLTAVVSPKQQTIYILSPLTELAFRRAKTTSTDFSSIDRVVDIYNDEVAKQYGIWAGSNTSVTEVEPTDIGSKPAPTLNNNSKEDRYAIVLAALSQMGKDRKGVGSGTDTASVINMLDTTNQGTNTAGVKGGGTNTAGVKAILVSALDRLRGNSSFTYTANGGNTTALTTLTATIKSKNTVTAVTTITASIAKNIIDFGSSTTVTVVVSPTTVTDSSVNYYSNNTTIVTINANGEITAIGAGTTTIRVTSNDDPTKFVTRTITVGENPNKNYQSDGSLTFGITNQGINKTLTFTAGASYTFSVQNNGGKGAKSYSSSNTKVATVNSATGEVTIIGIGTATIAVTLSGDNYHHPKTVTYEVAISQGV